MKRLLVNLAGIAMVAGGIAVAWQFRRPEPVRVAEPGDPRLPAVTLSLSGSTKMERASSVAQPIWISKPTPAANDGLRRSGTLDPACARVVPQSLSSDNHTPTTERSSNRPLDDWAAPATTLPGASSPATTSSRTPSRATMADGGAKANATDRQVPTLAGLEPPPQLADTFPAPDLAWAERTGPVEQPPVIREHRLRDGDTLDRLAERFLGDASRADEIFAGNREVLESPDILPIGKTIRIVVTQAE